jgi:hypothetical protein
MRFAVVEGKRREAQAGLLAECPICGVAVIANAGALESGIGRIDKC